MKKFQKLIPAFCLLLVSAVLMGTSTFAWFSMNKNVTATGMTIKANSDNPFLVIAAGNTFDSSSIATNVSTKTTEKKLYPVMPVSALTSANVTTAASWQYAYSNDPDSATKTGDYIACTDLTNYVASEKFMIGLNEKSGVESAANLKLTGVTIDANKGIGVVVVCGTNIYTFTETFTSSGAETAKALATEVTKTGTEVTVYYYLNGEDTNVKTTNAENLGGSVTLNFAID